MEENSSERMKSLKVEERIVVLFLVVLSFYSIIITQNLEIDTTTDEIQNFFDARSLISADGSPHVVFDVAHGYEVFIPAKVSPMGAILAKNGYEMTTLYKGDRFNDTILNSADVVVIVHPDPAMPYLQSEIDSLKSYWDNGGSLLLVGCSQGNPYARLNTELNRIMGELNIEASFSTLETGGYNDSLTPHFVTSSVESIFVRGAKIDHPNNELYSVLSSKTGNSYFLAYENQTSNQRAILLGDVGPLEEFLSTYASDLNWNNYTNRYQLILNIYQWLSYQNFKPIGDPEPIMMFTYGNNHNTKNELRKLDLVKGICHFHTDHSDGSATVQEAGDSFDELEYDFIVIADHGTGSAIQPLRNYRDSKGYPFKVIGGEELSPTIVHVLGWGFNDTVPDPNDPLERIELLHSLSSPAYLAHPSWAVYDPPYERIWDHDLFPFDGYEIVNSGYIQGNGNLAMYPWYVAADTHGNTAGSFSTNVNYALTDTVSDNPEWWNEALLSRRIMGYIRKDNLYTGDKIILDEIYGRLTDEAAPEIVIETDLTFGNQLEITVYVFDDSPLESVSMQIEGLEVVLTESPSNYSIYTGTYGPVTEGSSISIVVSSIDEKGFSSTESVTYTTPTDSTSGSSTTSQSTHGFTLFTIGLVIIIAVYRRER